MRGTAVKLLPALLLPGLLAACLLPPFDRGLSLAQATASKLKLEARIGPLYRWRGELERGRSFFLPSKTLGLNCGFLLVFAAFDGRLFYVTYDTAGEYFITGDHVFPVMNSNENTFNYGAYVLKDTSGTDDDALLLVRPNLAADQRMEYSCNSGTITTQQYDFTESPAWVASGTAAVGAGMYPNSLSTAFDFLTLLVYNEGSFKYYERISNFGFSSPTWTPSWTDSGEFD